MKRADIPDAQMQRILDYLNEHGETAVDLLVDALPMNRQTLGNYLRHLKRYNAVAQRIAGVPGTRARRYFYSALMRDLPTSRDPGESIRAEIEKKLTILGRRVHLGTNRDHPHPNQRGQGAISEHPGVASSAEFL